MFPLLGIEPYEVGRSAAELQGFEGIQQHFDLLAFLPVASFFHTSMSKGMRKCSCTGIWGTGDCHTQGARQELRDREPSGLRPITGQEPCPTIAEEGCYPESPLIPFMCSK